MEVLIYPEIQNLIRDIEKKFDSIDHNRKLKLKEFAKNIHAALSDGQHVHLLYVCTHNSRRSHFGQIAAALAIIYYRLKNIDSYSAGTEVTAFHKNGINALLSLGFKTETAQETDMDNPVIEVKYGNSPKIICFSKNIQHHDIPRKNLFVIYTCSEAELNCPVIIGASHSISLPHPDPKSSDSDENQKEVYINTFKAICREVFFMMSLV